MAVNDRIEHKLSDIEDFTQLSVSQANRKFFTPGKANQLDNPSVNLEQNWPIEWVVKTGNPVFDNSNGIIHDRVLKQGRSSICDQTIPAPNVLGVDVVTVTGSGYMGTATITNTATQNNNGKQERKTGWENEE